MLAENVRNKCKLSPCGEIINKSSKYKPTVHISLSK